MYKMMQLCVYWKCMKPDISFPCTKSPCFPPVKTKETKKETKQKSLSFIILKVRAETKVMMTKIDDDQNFYR